MMVLYFSATGNCKFVAEAISRATNDIAVSITSISDKILLNSGEALGIVTPTYFWGLPSIVEEFLEKVTVENAEKAYIYCVVTYGGTCGQAEYYVNKLLKTKGLALSAGYGIKTVDNWTVWFDATDKDKISKALTEEAKQLDNVIKYIVNKECVYISKDTKPRFICNRAKYFYNRARRTKHLNVNADCTACGKCMAECPVGAIKLENGKPTWIKERCAMCLHCLHACPKFAINYDNKTQKHGQYMHP